MTEYVFYKISCTDPNINFCYIGSTKDYTARKYAHRLDCNNNKKNHIKVYKTINENGGWDNWTIAPIGRGVFADRLSARIEEQRYISENNALLNTYKALITKEDITRIKKQYVINNYQKVLDNNKNYRERNKEVLKQRKKANVALQAKLKTKHVCECGGHYVYHHKSTHCKTGKHLKYLETKTN